MSACNFQCICIANCQRQRRGKGRVERWGSKSFSFESDELKRVGSGCTVGYNTNNNTKAHKCTCICMHSHTHTHAHKRCPGAGLKICWQLCQQRSSAGEPWAAQRCCGEFIALDVWRCGSSSSVAVT